ncbi:helix-turn-helix domain-containing protein [Streptomyces sp. NPDC059753]|uniref:helix-turn-helix domain-containing protein n=1 Tax=Streptomyces sp. NPDC059753 TaxID=3346933 RepID=UPI0036545830
MQTDESPTSETFAQVLAELMTEYKVNGSEVARAIGVSVSTVNTWLHGKRTPRPDAIRQLAGAFPKYTETRLATAADRRMPGPLSTDAKERLLEVFEGLTAEQQEMLEIQARALRDSNR